MTDEKLNQDITQNNNNQGESLASSSRTSTIINEQQKAKFQASYRFIFRYYLLKKNDWNYYFENTQELRKKHKEFPPSELDKWQKETEEEVEKSNLEYEKFKEENYQKQEGETKQDLILPKIGEISAKRKFPAPEALIRSSKLLKSQEINWTYDFALIRKKEKNPKVEFDSDTEKSLEKYKEGQKKYFTENSTSHGRAIWELYGENVAAKEVIESLEYEKLTIARMVHDYQNEVIQGLEMIKSEREKEQQATEKQIWELNQEKERQAEESKRTINDLNKKLSEAGEKSELLDKTLTEWKQKETEAKQQEQNLLTEKQKALESKEKVELTEIKQKYEAELAKAQNQEQEIEIKNKALSNYIRLINQQEEEKIILASKYKILNSERGIISADNLQLKNQKAFLEIEYNSEKRQRANDKKTYEANLETWTIKYDTEKHENEQKHQEILKKILEIRDLNKEINDLKFEKLNTADEIDKLKEAKDKEIKRNEELNEKNTKLKGGQLYQLFNKIGLNSLWAIASNGVIIVGILIFLYLFSFLWKWIIKPIYKNFRGEKKGKLRKQKVKEKQPPTIPEVEESEEDEILEVKEEVKKLPKRTRKKKVSS